MIVRPVTRRARLVAVLAATATAGACGAAPLPLPSPSAPVLPADPDVVVIRTSTFGGLPPPPELRWVPLPPDVAITADGRVFRYRFPEGAVQPVAEQVVVSRIGPATVADLLARAAATGVHADGEIDCPGLFDAGTTAIETVIDGSSARLEVYAAGIGDLCEDVPAAGLERRAAAEAFLDALTAPPGETERVPYVPSRVALYVGSADLGGPVATGEQPSPVPALATFGEPLQAPGEPPSTPFERCGILEGPALEQTWPLIALADRGTLWVSDGERYRLGARPLLPGDAAACPPA